MPTALTTPLRAAQIITDAIATMVIYIFKFLYCSIRFPNAYVAISAPVAIQEADEKNTATLASEALTKDDLLPNTL